MRTTPTRRAALALTLAALGGVAAQAATERADGMYAEFTTSKGKIVARLHFDKTPITVANFVALAEGKMTSSTRKGRYYDGLNFHRVIPNFMIQGGCPLGTGTGGPGYKFEDEVDTGLTHKGPGILSMANAGPGTNGSQFFITHKATSWLDGKHTVFGEVVDGQKVVDAIVKGDKIEKLEIVRVGKAANAFQADQAAFDKLRKDKVANASAALEAKIQKQFPKLEKTASGLRFVRLKEGSGPTPTKGAKVTAHYEGRFLDGKVFDSSYKRGRPFDFKVGMGQVIKGWDEALSAMKKGEKRTLVVPPELGYGARGAGRVIPPNATLVFDVELLDFTK